MSKVKPVIRYVPVVWKGQNWHQELPQPAQGAWTSWVIERWTNEAHKS